MTKMPGDGLGQTLYLGHGFTSKDGYYSPFNTATREQKNALLASAIRVQKIRSPPPPAYLNTLQLPKIEKI